MILDNLAEGATRDEILLSYPSLRSEHVDAALAYAAQLAHEERLVHAHGDLGLCASGDDAFLTLRGLRTLSVRLKRHQESATDPLAA